VFDVYATMDPRMTPDQVAEHARRAETLGYDGLNVPEAVHDGLVMSQIALQATTRLRVATSVLVAFPRSPMAVAHAAWDLQRLSNGRFELGLGSQVRGNIVGRYSTPWSPPVPRMREYIGALRAIFDAFQEGTPLDFVGDHYQFTRLQPFFNPGPLDCASIPLYLGAVGPQMTALAGEAADGLMTHPSNTPPRYLREVTRPRLKAGASRSGRSGVPRLMVSALLATGETQQQVRADREKQRELLGFLYSTPAYWGSLELFGWRDRGEQLLALSREGKWGEMPGLLTDEMLDTFVPTAAYGEIAGVLRERYASLCDWITFPIPADPAQDRACRKAIAELKESSL
jgi:probable F420-dependent oxidoreductase